MDITGVLTQGVESAPFDLQGGECYAFQIEFEGGKRKKFKVAVTDLAKGLSYIAAGIGAYNNKEVDGSPAAFERCNGDFDGASARPQCWGQSWTDVGQSGFVVEDDGSANCDDDTFPYTRSVGQDSEFEFKFRSSDGAKCKTEDGTYYLYVYAESATTVSFDVTTGNVKKSSCKNEQAGAIVALILVILIPICCCCAIAGLVVFCIQAQQNKKPHAQYSTTTTVQYSTAQGQTPGQAYSGAQDWGTSQPYGQPQPGPAQVGAGSAAQPITGTVVGGPQVVQGTVVGGAKPAYFGAPPAYGA